MRAKEAMTSPAITVTSETHCKDAAALMVRHRISALPVVDASGRLVRLVSEADLVPLEATPDPRSQTTPQPRRLDPVPRQVDEVMARGVYTMGSTAAATLVKVIAPIDEEVEAGVRSTLKEEGMRLTGLRVRVRDGVVELTGDSDRQTLRLAEILARSVPGVLDVRVVAREGRPASRSERGSPWGTPTLRSHDRRQALRGLRFTSADAAATDGHEQTQPDRQADEDDPGQPETDEHNPLERVSQSRCSDLRWKTHGR